MQRQLDALQGSSSSSSKQAQQAIAAERAMQEAMLEYDQRLRDTQFKLERATADSAAVQQQADALRAQLASAQAAQVQAQAEAARAAAAESTSAAVRVVGVSIRACTSTCPCTYACIVLFCPDCRMDLGRHRQTGTIFGTLHHRHVH
jgi:hypothetical protein